ncbi:MAG: RNA polymerase sigma factor [Candidatus Polarisedimenticolia bacterium]
MASARALTAAEARDACPLSDGEVVERVRAGETALFEVLMRRYNQRVYRVARAILGNDTEAEDVMQDAYVRAYAHLDQYAGRASFPTWLTRIAVHEALARARRSRRFDVLDPESEPLRGDTADPPAVHRDPERRMFDHEMKTLLEAAIEGLPGDYRAVFVLREVEGMSTAETAESLGVSADVVKTRLHRARSLLRDELYDRAGSASPAAFEFNLSRCDRVVDAVLRRIHAAVP